MVLHGTGGSGRQFLAAPIRRRALRPGPAARPRPLLRHPPRRHRPRPLVQAERRPAAMRFPHYDYDDMVEAQRLMLERLGVTRLRLLMGTSMGCMHGFVWAETHPDFVRAIMPMACLPTEIAGHNRMWRRMAVEGIRRDPAWAGRQLHGRAGPGPAHRRQPAPGRRLRAALSPARLSDPRDGRRLYRRRGSSATSPTRDANDLIYQLEASRTYNPLPNLERIRTPMTWVNSRRRFHQPARLRHRRSRGAAHAERALRADPGERRDARARHAHLGAVLAGGAGRSAAADGDARLAPASYMVEGDHPAASTCASPRVSYCGGQRLAGVLTAAARQRSDEHLRELADGERCANFPRRAGMPRHSLGFMRASGPSRPLHTARHGEVDSVRCLRRCMRQLDEALAD